MTIRMIRMIHENGANTKSLTVTSSILLMIEAEYGNSLFKSTIETEPNMADGAFKQKCSILPSINLTYRTKGVCLDTQAITNGACDHHYLIQR